MEDPEPKSMIGQWLTASKALRAFFALIWSHWEPPAKRVVEWLARRLNR